MSGDGGLPPRARALVLVTAAAGAVAVAIQLPEMLKWAVPDLAALLGLGFLMVLTEQFPVSLRHQGEGETFALTDAIWVAGLMLVSPAVLVLAVAGGTVTGQLLQKVSATKIVFNLGQYLIGMSVAVLVFHSLNPAGALEPRTWLAATAAMAAFFLVNAGAVALIISLVTGESFGSVVWSSLPLSLLHWAGNMAIGILGAVIWVAAPLGITLLVAPLALSYVAYSGWLRTMRERDQMHEMARTADAISEQHDLSQRLPITGRDDEIGQLARTLNAMLNRLERSFLRERRFLSEASHELRTPITICRGNLEVLPPNASRHEVDETIGVVIDELGRMGRIVGDMTTLARMEDPNHLEPAAVPLDRFLHDLSAKALPLTDGRLRIGDVPPGAVVKADPHRLTQALLNLLQNSQVHAPGTGPVRLDVRQRARSWRFEVADHGAGVPVGQEERIFEPFRRVNGRMPGTGLGLAIVRAIADAHGGSAGVDNHPGLGATFWVEVPR